MSEAERDYPQRHLASVCFCDSMTTTRPDAADALAVLTTAQLPPTGAHSASIDARPVNSLG